MIPRRALTEETKAAVLECVRNGMSYPATSARTGVPVSSISRIVRAAGEKPTGHAGRPRRDAPRQVFTVTKPPREPWEDDPTDWRTEAACRGNWDPFHPPGVTWKGHQDRAEAALAICNRGPCPVRTACLNWALRIRDDIAIAGGMTPKQRRKLSRRKAS